MEKNQRNQLITDVVIIIMLTAVIGMNMNLKNINAVILMSIITVTVIIGLLTYRVAKSKLKEKSMDNAYLILRNVVLLCIIVILLLEYIG